VGSLTSGQQWLAAAALRYALASTELVKAPLLSCPTPCAGWDLDGLLNHVAGSVDLVLRAITTGCADTGPRAAHHSPGANPVDGLQQQAARLLATCVAGKPSQHVVTVSDRKLSTSMVAVVGALEITVHGWDISVASGSCRPIPFELAAILLPLPPLLVTPATRRGLFADPVRVPADTSPGDQLVAFLGRQPRLPAVPPPRAGGK
jgi:uncharacterized protein (TIGR03086 family)